MALNQASKKVLHRSVHPLIRRHQSTFSFFSRNSITSQPPPPPPAAEPSKSTSDSLSSPLHPNALKISPTYANAAPLLQAIENKDPDTVWMVYSVLVRANLLHTLLPLHHSMLLKSFRPQNRHRFTMAESRVLVDRFDQVWDNMIHQAHIQPDINDHTARFELLAATRQYAKFDQAWLEFKEAAGLNSTIVDGGRSRNGIHNDPVASSSSSSSLLMASSVLQPTVYTFNLVLSSCVRRRNIVMAMETIRLMRKVGIKPDNMSWDYVLQIHTRCKNWPAVEALFRKVFVTDMTNIRLRNNNNSNTANNNSMNQSNDKHHLVLTVPLGQKAQSLHGGIFQESTTTTTASATATASTGSITKDKQQKLVPSLQNIHTLFSYFAYTQDLEELRRMFDRYIHLFQLLPTTRSYNEMMKFAFLARRDDDALELFKELVQIGQNLKIVQEQKLQQEQEQQQQQQQQEQEHEIMVGSSTSSLSSSESSMSSSSAPAGSGATTTTSSSSSSSSSSPSRTKEQEEQQQSHYQVVGGGPDFNTFQILINNELIDSRNRWGRAWKWMQLMQDGYGLEPSDTMFRRTLSSMKRRGPNQEKIQALERNWEEIKQRRRQGAGRANSNNNNDNDVLSSLPTTAPGGRRGGGGGFGQFEDDQQQQQQHSESGRL
ncbi:hypothetical protein BG004_007593 [Podila humilis]|nr:hypothetical protein BG004_007593 [Podila humilis]